MVAAAIVIAALFTGLLNGTRLGLSTRAVIMNETLAHGLGIDSTRVRLITFGIGCGLAGARRRADHAARERRSQHGPALADRRLHAGHGFRRLAADARRCRASCSAALQVLVRTFISPILGGLTIAVLAAVALRLRPEGFARA